MGTDVSSGPIFLIKKRTICSGCQLRANLPQKQKKRDTRELFQPVCHMRTQRSQQFANKKQALTRRQICGHLDFGFPASRTVRQSILVILCHLVCGPLLWQPQESNTRVYQCSPFTSDSHYTEMVGKGQKVNLEEQIKISQERGNLENPAQL